MHEKFNLQRGLRKLYAQPNSLKSQEFQDLECWFNLEEFAEFHDIDGKKILGVFTSDIFGKKFVEANQDISGMVSKSNGILFLRCEDVGNVNVDMPLRLDGKLYQIEEAVKLGNIIWRLKLSATLS